MVWAKTDRTVSWCLSAPEGSLTRRGVTALLRKHCIGVRDQLHALAGLLRGKERPELLFYNKRLRGSIGCWPIVVPNAWYVGLPL